MTGQEDGRQERGKIRAMIEDIEVAMFVTHMHDDGLRSRPMAALGHDDDGPLWFASRPDTSKLGEIADHTCVLLAYAEPKKQSYVSVSGRASIVDDRTKIAELWTESLRVWFAEGPGDPSITLIRVDIEGAEYWDAPSSAWIQSLGYAKARLTGEALHDVGRNETVSF